MNTITVKQILVLHEFLIRKHHGASGIRDIGLLKSAIGRPFATFSGEDLYPEIYLKAGALIQSIVKNHPFVDGNKRTAFVSTMVLLKINNIHIGALQKDVVKFMLDVANKNLSVEDIASWLKEHVRKP